MQRKESAIEVKVGVLVLVSIVTLIAFIAILGDFRFGKQVVFYVDFNNASGLKNGAQVRVAGIPAGTVSAVRFMGGAHDPEVDRRVYVRVTLRVDEAMRENIRQDAEFNVTTQGVLGEPYVEITSLDPTLEPVRDGQVFQGIDPPRLDMIIASAYEGIESLRRIVDQVATSMEDGELRIEDFVNNIGSLAGSLDERIRNNEEQIDGIFRNVDGLLEENRDRLPVLLDDANSAINEYGRLGRSLNRAVGDGTDLRTTIRNAASISNVVDREVEPTLVSVRETADSARRILGDNEESLQRTIANAESASLSVRNATADAETIVGRIERGEGTVGRLLTDEEIFEDMREFVRELKRRPWRIIWKE
ncbi:MAG: MCE family protein [Deltaproteobacteria bacterium]|nr:MAG: MCE family protein [Deltaproteobacteria bacterium]